MTGQRRSLPAIAVVAIGLVLVFAACVPLFPSGGALVATPQGPFVALSWPAATDNDPGAAIDHYAIEVGGTVVANVAAPATTCLVTGLVPGSNYSLAVTAWG